MKIRYERLDVKKTRLYKNLTFIRVFKFVWRRYFYDCEIIKITSWRGAKVSQTDPLEGGRLTHVTACPKWAPWLD